MAISAQEVLERTFRTYAACRSYRDEGEIEEEFGNDPKPFPLVRRLPVGRSGAGRTSRATCLGFPRFALDARRSSAEHRSCSRRAPPVPFHPPAR